MTYRFNATMTAINPEGKKVTCTIALNTTCGVQEERVEWKEEESYLIFFRRMVPRYFGSGKTFCIKDEKEYERIIAPWIEQKVHERYPLMLGATTTYT